MTRTRGLSLDVLDRLTDVAGGHEPLALAAAGHWETPDEVGQPSERRRLALGILVPEIPDPKIWRDQLTNMLHDFHGVLLRRVAIRRVSWRRRRTRRRSTC